MKQVGVDRGDPRSIRISRGTVLTAATADVDKALEGVPAHEKNAAVHLLTKVFVNVGRAALQKKEASSPEEPSLRGTAASLLESFA